MLRLFFALQPSAIAGARLLEQVAPLAAQLAVPTVPPGNLHATLCFIGAVPPERLDALREAAATVRGAPGELRFDALDHWDTPRVLVAVPGGECRESLRLADALRDAAVEAGFSPDIKPFRPHLTLARKIPSEAAKKFAWPLPLSPGFVVRVEKFVLMESRRGEQGSIYSVLDSWPLDGSRGT
jgi:2'-5' RNA ligase